MADPKGIVIKGRYEDGGVTPGLQGVAAAMQGLADALNVQTQRAKEAETAIDAVKEAADPAAAALERIVAASDDVAKTIGRAEPEVRDLRHEYESLADQVRAGAITQEDAARRYGVSVTAQRRRVAELIRELRALTPASEESRAAIDAQVASLRRLGAAARQVQGEGLARINAQARDQASVFATLGRRILPLVGAYQAISLARRSLDAARTQEVAERRVAVALGENADKLQTILDLASELQREGIFGDEDILKGAAALLNAGVAAEDVADRLRVVNDVAAATGVSIEQVARGIGLFAQGTAGELGERIPELRALAKEGRLAGEGVDFLRERFGGAAREIADTDLGRMTKAANQFGDAMEDVGTAIAALLSGPASKLAEFTGKFAESVAFFANPSGTSTLTDQLGKLLQARIGTLDSAGLAKLQADLESFIAAAKEAQAEYAKTLRPDLVQGVNFGIERQIAAAEERINVLARRQAELGAAGVGGDGGATELPAIVVKPGIDALAEGIARLGEVIGREAPRVATLQDAYDDLAAGITDGTVTVEDAVANFADAIEVQDAAIGAYLQALDEIEPTTEDQAKAVDELAVKLIDLRDALKEVGDDGIKGLRGEIAPATGLIEGFSRTFEDLIVQGADFANLGSDLASGLVFGLENIISLAAQGKLKFSEFAKSFLADMAAMIARTLLFNAIAGAFGFATGGGGGGGAPFQGPTLSGAPLAYHGGHFTGGKFVRGYYAGGLVNGPRAPFDNVILKNAALSGGEYVTPTARVDQYGLSFFESVRNGSFPTAVARALGAGPIAAQGPHTGRVGGGQMPTLRSKGAGGVTVAFVANDGQQADRIGHGDIGREIRRQAQRQFDSQ